MDYQTDHNTADILVKDVNTLANASVAAITAFEAIDPAVTDAATLAAIDAPKDALVATVNYTKA